MYKELCTVNGDPGVRTIDIITLGVTLYLHTGIFHCALVMLYSAIDDTSIKHKEMNHYQSPDFPFASF